MKDEIPEQPKAVMNPSSYPERTVQGPVLHLASKVAEVLEGAETSLVFEYGTFYISRAEIVFYGGEDATETCGYLESDEFGGWNLVLPEIS